MLPHPADFNDRVPGMKHLDRPAERPERRRRDSATYKTVGLSC